jgi:molybdopterin-guanine dinucleotide biosynthesis protein A
MRCSGAIICDPGVDRALVEARAGELRELCDEILLCAPAISPELLACGLPVVAARVAGSGDLGGLHAALSVARADAVLALDGSRPCAIDASRRLAEHPGGSNVLLAAPVSGLPGRYRRGCLAALRRALLEGRELDAILGELHAAHLGLQRTSGHEKE